MIINKIIGFLQKKIATSNFMILILLKIRNQLSEIIKLSQNDGSNMENNGESLLLKIVAPQINNFIDVGANLGVWSKSILIFNSKLSGFLFEPSPKCVQELHKIFKQETENNSVSIVGIALSDVQEKKMFFLEDDFGESSSLVKFDNVQYDESLYIDVSTLDLQAKRLNISTIDFLKIDAEGFDLKVIKGSIDLIKNNKIKIIQFEYNYPWIYAGSTLFDAIETLKSFNYKIFQIRKDGIYSYDYNKYGDYFGYSNFIAVSSDSIEMISRLIKS
jgi:FkbM family methyltransferase